MFLRLLKKTVKIFAVIYVFVLVLRFSGICESGDGFMFVSEPISDGSALFEAYSEIEERASSLVPSVIRRALSRLSEWIADLL